MLIALVNEKVCIYHNTVIKKTSSNKDQNLLDLSFDIELSFIFLTTISVTSAGKSPYERGFLYTFILWEDGSNRFSSAEYVPDWSVTLPGNSSSTKVESSGIGTLFFLPLYRLTSYSSFFYKINQK
jgi:hypothetical protein